MLCFYTTSIDFIWIFEYFWDNCSKIWQQLNTCKLQEKNSTEKCPCLCKQVLFFKFFLKKDVWIEIANGILFLTWNGANIRRGAFPRAPWNFSKSRNFNWFVPLPRKFRFWLFKVFTILCPPWIWALIQALNARGWNGILLPKSKHLFPPEHLEDEEDPEGEVVPNYQLQQEVVEELGDSDRQSNLSGISQQDRDNKTILLRQAASGKDI